MRIAIVVSWFTVGFYNYKDLNILLLCVLIGN